MLAMPVALALAPLVVMLADARAEARDTEFLAAVHESLRISGRCPRSRTCPQSLFTQGPKSRFVLKEVSHNLRLMVCVEHVSNNF